MGERSTGTDGAALLESDKEEGEHQSRNHALVLLLPASCFRSPEPTTASLPVAACCRCVEVRRNEEHRSRTAGAVCKLAAGSTGA